MKRTGAGIAVRRGAAVLLVRRRDDGQWDVPGGGSEGHEAPEDTARREVREETGWTIGGARRLGAYRRHCFMPEYGFWAEKLCSIWLARPILRQGPPTEPGHSAHWVPLAEAAARLPDPGARAFMRALARRHGWKGFKGH